MTQPPLIRQIQFLERELQAQLFVRNSWRVELTVAGRVLLPNARWVLDLSAKTSLEVSRSATGDAGAVFIGYAAVAGKAVLPQLLRAASKHLLHVTLVLREAVSVEQLDALSKGSIDMGMLRPIVIRAGIQTQLIKKDRLALPEGHDLATGKGVFIKELVGLPVMMYSTGEARYFYDLVLRLFDSVGARLDIAQIASQIPALLALVAAGLGVTLVPATAMEFTPRGVVFEEITGANGLSNLNHSDMYLAWDESSTNPAAALLRKIFLDSLAREAEEAEEAGKTPAS